MVLRQEGCETHGVQAPAVPGFVSWTIFNPYRSCFQLATRSVLSKKGDRRQERPARPARPAGRVAALILL